MVILPSIVSDSVRDVSQSVTTSEIATSADMEIKIGSFPLTASGKQLTNVQLLFPNEEGQVVFLLKSKTMKI